MKLAKAIEILEHHGLKPDNTTWQDFLDAVKLGKEALERIRYGRMHPESSITDQLLGETDE